MSIIIRLQNLPWAANALDIRQYFNGLQIPEGGVHIVGGELGDAFIAFRYYTLSFTLIFVCKGNVMDLGKSKTLSGRKYEETEKEFLKNSFLTILTEHFLHMRKN